MIVSHCQGQFCSVRLRQGESLPHFIGEKAAECARGRETAQSIDISAPVYTEYAELID